MGASYCAAGRLGRLGAAFPRRRHSRPPVCRTAMARRGARRLTLLVHSEQGLGDVIQFARYPPVIAGKVVLETRPRLMRLLSSNPALSHMIPAGGTPPPVDTVIPLLSLPARTRITPSESSYLFAETDRIVAWRDRVGPADRVSVSPGRAVPADSRTRADRCRGARSRRWRRCRHPVDQLAKKAKATDKSPVPASRPRRGRGWTTDPTRSSTQRP
jgi:hypothetical protein